MENILCAVALNPGCVVCWIVVSNWFSQKTHRDIKYPVSDGKQTCFELSFSCYHRPYDIRIHLNATRYLYTVSSLTPLLCWTHALFACLVVWIAPSLLLGSTRISYEVLPSATFYTSHKPRSRMYSLRPPQYLPSFSVLIALSSALSHIRQPTNSWADTAVNSQPYTKVLAIHRIVYIIYYDLSLCQCSTGLLKKHPPNIVGIPPVFNAFRAGNPFFVDANWNQCREAFWGSKGVSAIFRYT